MKKISKILIVIVLLSFLSSCAMMKKKHKAKPEFIVHKVQYTGETLGFIARWYSGNFEKWKEIQAYNAIKNPNAISLGQEIKVPMSIVIQDKAPPKSFFSSGRGAVPANKPPSKSTPAPLKPAVITPEVKSDLPTPVLTTEATSSVEVTPAPLATSASVQEEPLDDKTRDKMLDELLEDSQ